MPPNSPAPCLYQGHVMHMRLAPFPHKFRYRVFALLLDLDQLEPTCAPLRLLRLDRFGLMSFHRADHGPRDGSDLRLWVAARLAEAGRPPRRSHHAFVVSAHIGLCLQPFVSLFLLGRGGAAAECDLRGQKYLGDQHPYVLAADQDPDGAVRHAQTKGFFVSPFIGMDQTYDFTLREPGDRLSVKIRQGDAAGSMLIATQSGQRRPLSDAELLRQWLRHPLMTVKVMAAIHWQALKLWLKGARFARYPGPYPATNTHPTRPA